MVSGSVRASLVNMEKWAASDAESAKLQWLHFASESLHELQSSFLTFKSEPNRTSSN